jgi:hypothetical protein
MTGCQYASPGVSSCDAAAEACLAVSAVRLVTRRDQLNRGWQTDYGNSLSLAANAPCEVRAGGAQRLIDGVRLAPLRLIG